MAHHNRTPQTVLDAPSIDRRWEVMHLHPNRAQRRTTAKYSGKPMEPGIHNLPLRAGQLADPKDVQRSAIRRLFGRR